MLQSRLFLPTLKEDPSDADVISHRLMVRAGLIRKLAGGIYNLLPVGLRIVRKVEEIVREEMDRSGAQEILMPIVIPSELWIESGRWHQYGKEMLRCKDRHGRDFCLAPTHEEVITDMARRDIRSYKELPINLYQIQTKFRDEVRPRFGLMRGREFIMKDAYSFHATDEDAEIEYEKMQQTYCAIFERCGLDFRMVEADTGSIGGSFSHEFMVLAETGEDSIAECNRCKYVANIEKAETRTRPIPNKDLESPLPMSQVATPKAGRVDEVCGFLGIAPQKLIKTLIYNYDKGIVAILIRGDYEMNETKLKRVIDAKWIEMAGSDTVMETTGASTGFAGPIGLNGCKILADHSIRGIINAVAGANKDDTHFINVNTDRDFNVDRYYDLRYAIKGDQCPRCKGTIDIWRGIEVGHIFKLGNKYSESMKSFFLDERGKRKPMIMGCYGIGIGRTVAAAIEQNHDDSGIVWPAPLSPFQVHIIPMSMSKPEINDLSQTIYARLNKEGIETLIDDRSERVGIKLNDADLLGIRFRLIIGKRAVENGIVELVARAGKKSTDLPVANITERVREILGASECKTAE